MIWKNTIVLYQFFFHIYIGNLRNSTVCYCQIYWKKYGRASAQWWDNRNICCPEIIFNFQIIFFSFIDLKIFSNFASFPRASIDQVHSPLVPTARVNQVHSSFVKTARINQVHCPLVKTARIDKIHCPFVPTAYNTK